MSARPPQFGNLWRASSMPTPARVQPKRSPSQPGEAPEKTRAPCPYEACLPHSLLRAHMFFRLPATSPSPLLPPACQLPTGSIFRGSRGDVKSMASDAWVAPTDSWVWRRLPETGRTLPQFRLLVSRPPHCRGRYRTWGASVAAVDGRRELFSPKPSILRKSTRHQSTAHFPCHFLRNADQ